MEVSNATDFPDATVIVLFNDAAESADKVEGSNYSMPLLVAYVTLALFGCIGNILVIGAVFVHHKLRVLSNAFVVNLALADLSVAAVINGFGILGLIRVDFFLDKPALCEVIGTVCVTSCCGSLWSIASIGINRYVAICHRNLYNRIYTPRTMVFHLALIWSICFLADIPNFFGMGDHQFDPVLLVCTFDYRESYNYNIFLFIFAFCLPMVFIVFSYFKIYTYAQSVSKELHRIRTGEGNCKAKTHSKIRTTDRRLLRTILMLVVFFCIMWAPFSLIVVIDRDNSFSPLVFILAASLSHTNSSINWLLYCATNKHFREGYRLFILTVCCCGRLTRDKESLRMRGIGKFLSRRTNESTSRESSRTNTAMLKSVEDHL
ncbi:melatonin receptor type 1A-like [Diadema antillarum]|uniref:melatonin receptor type 1A-like n=1 Tax=Diadema antillarum TaxID=105358 RepID=UPI003A8C3397